MIRLLQGTTKTIPLFNNISYLFCKKGINKLFKQKIKKQQIPIRQTSISQPSKIKMAQIFKRNDKQQKFKQPQQQEPTIQQRQPNQLKQSFNKKVETINKLKQMMQIQAKQFQLIEQRLQEQINSLTQQVKANSQYYDFQLIKLIIPILIDTSTPINEKLFIYIMQGFFSSHFITDLSNQYQIIDRKAYQFLNKYRHKIYQYLQNSRIKRQLRFYFYFKGISDRRSTVPAFRLIYNQYFTFLYPLIQKNFQQIDFSSDFGYQIIEIFNRTIRKYLLNSQDIKLINSICSQVPFFETKSIIKFVIKNIDLINKGGNEIINSIIEVIKIDLFADVQLEQFQSIIKAFSQLAKKQSDINDKIGELLQILYHKIFEDIKKDGSLVHPKNIIFELLIELSKQIELKHQDQAENMFHYFNHYIESLAKCAGNKIIRQSNFLYQILTIFITNKFINRKIFESSITTMRKSLNKVSIKRTQLKGCYLSKWLQRQEQRLQIFNGQYLLELNSLKLITYIQQILELDDIQITKSLIIMLVNSQFNYPLLDIKRQLTTYNYYQTLTNINLALIKHQQIPFYYQIFSQLTNKQDFSDLAIELIQNLYQIQSVNKKQILQILFNSVFTKLQRKFGTKKTLSQTIYVLQYYINNPKYTQMMLRTASFYNLLKKMLIFISNNPEVNQLKINIYRMLGFIFEKQNSQLILNSLLEPVVRNLNILNQDTDRLKNVTYIYSFQKNLMRFKINHFVPQNEVDSIYQKTVHSYLRLQPYQIQIVMKLNNPQYLPQGQLSRQNIVAYFMDKNVVSLLSKDMDKVSLIIQESSQIELAIYLYYFQNDLQVTQSNLFKMVWNCFQQKLVNFDKILCNTILKKYIKKGLQQNLYQKLLKKVIAFYGNNMERFNKQNHHELMQIILNQYDNHQNSPIYVKIYVQKIREYIQTQLKYFNKHILLKHYIQLIQFGYQINYKQMTNLKQAIYQHNFGFYLIISLQDKVPKDQIQMMLAQYRQNRQQKQQSDDNKVNAYIQLKYPNVTLPIYDELFYRKSQYCRQIRVMQINRLRIINNIYTNFQYNKQYCYLANQKHLITFCDKKNRLFYHFLKKFYAIEPSTQHLQIHIFDFMEPNQPIFFTNLQANGIVSKQNTSKIKSDQELITMIEQQMDQTNINETEM